MALLDSMYNSVVSFSVTDPHRESGDTGPTLYRVQMRATSRSLSETTVIIVERRYSDFQWLHKQLRRIKLEKGTKFPPFPTGSVFGRFSNDTIEKRRKSALNLLLYVASIDVLFHSAPFSNFFSRSKKASKTLRSASVSTIASHNDFPAALLAPVDTDNMDTPFLPPSLDETTVQRQSGSTIVDEFQSRTGPVTLRDFAFATLDDGKNMIVRHRHHHTTHMIRTLLKPVDDDGAEESPLSLASDQYPIINALGAANPFVLSLEYVFESSDRVFLVFGHVQTRELFHRLAPPFPEDIVRFFVAEIVLAVAFLHSKSVLLRPIMPHNVLVDADGHIKLAYYNVCAEWGPQDNGCFRAPEASLQQGDTPAGDWWSLGALMYLMVNGRSLDEDFPLGVFPSTTFEFDEQISDDGAALVCALLTHDPADRPGGGASGAEEIMCHPFFREVDWIALQERQVYPPAMAMATPPSTPLVTPLGTPSSSSTSMPCAARNNSRESSTARRTLDAICDDEFDDIEESFRPVGGSDDEAAADSLVTKTETQ